MKEKHSQVLQKKMEVMKLRDENLTKQLKVFKSEVQQVEQDLETVTFQEHRVRAREFQTLEGQGREFEPSLVQ